MPQLDFFTWFNQVAFLILVLSFFYYSMAFRYLMLSMRLFKIRFKILEYRELATLALTLQMNTWQKDFTQMFIGILSNKVYSSVLMHQASSILSIKNSIFNSTTIAEDLEAIYLVHEQMIISDKLHVSE